MHWQRSQGGAPALSFKTQAILFGMINLMLLSAMCNKLLMRCAA